MLDKPCISVTPSKKQARYQPVIYCTYWPVLVPYNNWNIIEITPKPTPFDYFDEINQVVIDGVCDNMESLVQSGIYGAINIDYTTTTVLYLIPFISEAYTLQNNTQIHVQVISVSELVDKAQYL